MQKLVFSLLLIGALFVAAGLVRSRTAAEPTPYAPIGPGDTYLALGDSLAAGFTVGDPAEAYVARIASALRQTAPGMAVRNLAVPGETTGSFRAGQLPRALELIASERAAG